ncbi:hypothetical protein HN51_061240 [Arachis hypogaea]
MTTSALPSPDSPPTAAFSRATCATNASTIPIPTSLLFPLDDSSFNSLTRLSPIIVDYVNCDGIDWFLGLHPAVMETSLWGWPLGRWNG